MNTTKILIAGLVAGIVYFLLGWLFYLKVLMSTFESMSGSASGVSRGEEMIWWALILGNLLAGLLLSYIYGRWANISTPAIGAQAGAAIGFLVAGSYDLMIYGTTHISTLSGALLDIVVWTVMTAIAGAVAAWMLGRGK
jgi:hypothetical protein